MNNLCKVALENGGSVNQLLIPANMTEGLGLTNPSLVLNNGEYLLNLRHVQYSLYHSENHQNFQTLWGPLAYLNPEDDISLRTTNYLCQLDKNTLAIDQVHKVDTTKLDVKPVWEFIGLEDARLTTWNNQTNLIGVRRDTTTNGEGRMEISVVNDNWEEISRTRLEPPTPSYCEKNWMPILDMPDHFVKWTSPTEIVKIIPETNKTETVLVKEQIAKFPRDLRGGSQVITVGDYRIAITHEVDLWHNEQGKKDAHYYHRFIVWDKDWIIISQSEEFKFMTANIEFSCGLTFDGNDFIIPFGFQDSTAFILRLPRGVFEEMTNVYLFGETKYVSKGITPSNVEQFIKDPFNAANNFKLGEFYFNHGHTASALSFYLRSAEYSKNNDLTYESLLMVARCIATQGRRGTTEKGLWLNAIIHSPNRPEAYLFLSQWAESNKQYHEAYTNACIGLMFKDNSKTITKNAGYLGFYQLEFQKAVMAWWIGRSQESRDEFIKLVNKGTTLSPKYQELVQSNITSLGSGPDPFLRYHKGFYNDLKYKFPGAETIEKNYSQTYQDMFTLTMLDGKKKGTYFEIGAADPFKGSNTALLEEWGWTGTSLEILPHEVEKFKAARKNEIILCDATKFDYSALRGHIDYLQVDCEPPSTTFLILTMLPWDQCTFGVITYEHDHYTDVSGSYRKKSRDFLLSRGYVLVASNIAPNETSCYEDWYVHPKHVKEEIIKIMLAADDSIKNAEKYMFGKI
jgi:hypothetical protein